MTRIKNSNVHKTLGLSVTLALLAIIGPVASGAGTCKPIPGESYASIPIPRWKPAQRPPELHGDVNLALRAYTPTQGFLRVTDVPGGGDDPKAPQLAYLFAEPRLGQFLALYRVNNWHWDCDCRGGPITESAVTFAELSVQPGETIHVPHSGYEIGAGYEALLLYASENRLTLKYTAEDDVVLGYTLHLENVCVEPSLLALYRAMDQAGRHSLPALRAGQALGRARNDRLGVAIRDTGAFLDPRARRDWWRTIQTSEVLSVYLGCKTNTVAPVIFSGAQIAKPRRSWQIIEMIGDNLCGHLPKCAAVRSLDCWRSR